MLGRLGTTSLWFVGCALLCGSWGWAEVRKSEPAAKTNKVAKAPESPAFTKEREAAALTFVREHHPELGDLLAQLKQHNTREYQRAVRDLFRDSERLAQEQERNPKRYALDLAAWKLNSRIQVLVAQLSMSPNPDVEQQLRQALLEQAQLRREQLVAERERLSAKLAEIDRDLSDNMDQRVDTQLQKLLSGMPKVPAINKDSQP